MKKHWCIASDCDALVDAFDGRVCDGEHERAVGRGEKLKLSGGYNPKFVSILHRSCKRQCESLKN